jgi:hypothetical protein
MTGHALSKPKRQPVVRRAARRREIDVLTMRQTTHQSTQTTFCNRDENQFGRHTNRRTADTLTDTRTDTLATHQPTHQSTQTTFCNRDENQFGRHTNRRTDAAPTDTKKKKN